MNRKEPVCNRDCFHCIYSDCMEWVPTMTDFEKKCAEIANEPERKAEHTIREVRLFKSGKRVYYPAGGKNYF